MTLVLYLENLFMYCSLTIKKGRAHCSLWASWGLPVRMGGPPPNTHTPSSPPAGNIQFHSTEVGSSIPGKTSVPGWAQCPEAVVPCRGTNMTMAFSLLPNLRSFGNFSLFVGFAFCWLFCLIGSFACFCLTFTFGSQLLLQSNNLLSSQPTWVPEPAA